jgi:hypothetical protein
MNGNFDIVLYFTRCNSKPIEPSYEKIQSENPNMSIDDILDTYNLQKITYSEELKKYSPDNNSIKEDFVTIPDDDNFMNVVKNIEKSNYFIAWSESSLNTIKYK